MNPITKWARRLQALPLAVLAVFFVFPVAIIVLTYARLSDIADTITNTSLAKVWWFTLWQATLSTLLTVAVALPITWALTRHSFRSSRIVTGLVTVPFLMPAVVVATGVRAILPNSHVPAILWAHVVFNVAVIVRIVGPRWAMLDSTMEHTAADLGAGPVRTFIYVVFPHIRSALRNAAAMVFLFCFTSFAVIAILGGISRRTIESEIFTQAVRLGNIRTATALAIVQAVVVLAVLAIATKNTQQLTDDDTISTPHDESISQRKSISFYASIVIPLAIVITPLIAVVIRSFTMNGHFTLNGYKWLFNGTTKAVGVNIASTLITSLTFAVVCATLATTLALIIATARNTNVAISTFTALPLIVSAVTLGLGLIITFNQSPYDWRGERWLIPVIHAVIALPLALRTVSPALTAIPDDIHNASASLGANPLRTWTRIDLPLIRPALARAYGLCAAISLGEFGATSFLSRSGSNTIPIAIGQLLSHPGDKLNQSAFALATITFVAVATLHTRL
jgi:thiamine transport system permease protein